MSLIKESRVSDQCLLVTTEKSPSRVTTCFENTPPIREDGRKESKREMAQIKRFDGREVLTGLGNDPTSRLGGGFRKLPDNRDALRMPGEALFGRTSLDGGSSQKETLLFLAVADPHGISTTLGNQTLVSVHLGIIRLHLHDVKHGSGITVLETILTVATMTLELHFAQVVYDGNSRRTFTMINPHASFAQKPPCTRRL
jgi:hypothetical protein